MYITHTLDEFHVVELFKQYLYLDSRYVNSTKKNFFFELQSYGNIFSIYIYVICFQVWLQKSEV